MNQLSQTRQERNVNDLEDHPMKTSTKLAPCGW